MLEIQFNNRFVYACNCCKHFFRDSTLIFLYFKIKVFCFFSSNIIALYVPAVIAEVKGYPDVSVSHCIDGCCRKDAFCIRTAEIEFSGLTVCHLSDSAFERIDNAYSLSFKINVCRFIQCSFIRRFLLDNCIYLVAVKSQPVNITVSFRRVDIVSESFLVGAVEGHLVYLCRRVVENLVSCDYKADVFACPVC